MYVYVYIYIYIYISSLHLPVYAWKPERHGFVEVEISQVTLPASTYNSKDMNNTQIIQINK